MDVMKFTISKITKGHYQVSDINHVARRHHPALDNATKESGLKYKTSLTV